MNEADARTLEAMLARPYRTLRLSWHEPLSMLRVRTCVKPVQCFTLAAMTEMQFCLDDIAANPGIVRHLAMSSDVPSVFNFGGDLALFVLLARAGDVDSLKLYGRKCIDLIWWLENADAYGVHTLAMVQGDALGGGLEAALAFHKVIVQRNVQAGFPEVLFNLFPGMGAWNFTIRKAGFAVANDMILSGRMYNSEELQRCGLADMVVDSGSADAALEQLVRTIEPRHKGTLAALRARRTAAPIAHETFVEIVDQWAHNAVQLTDRDLRLMERLVRAQVRKVGGGEEGAVEEIKRIELEDAWRAAGGHAKPSSIERTARPH